MGRRAGAERKESMFEKGCEKGAKIMIPRIFLGAVLGKLTITNALKNQCTNQCRKSMDKYAGNIKTNKLKREPKSKLLADCSCLP